MANSELEDRLRFCVTLDRLKLVERRTYLTDASRHENSAEHSWHLALTALILLPHAQTEGLDVAKVLQLALLHDVPEILAGDTFVYDEKGREAAAEREHAAARELFGMLPEQEAQDLLALWEEQEAQETPEARFVAALDRLQPIMQNIASDGRAWCEHGITVDRILERNHIIKRESPVLWGYVVRELDRLVHEGKLASGLPAA